MNFGVEELDIMSRLASNAIMYMARFPITPKRTICSKNEEKLPFLINI